MATSSNTVLNELIELNNDRIAGFEKVLSDIDDANVDLKELFQEYATQSRRFSQELTAIVAARAGEPETGNSVAGTLHRAWIDVKALFGGSDRESILSEAERGEDAIKKAYQTAIAEGGLAGEALEKVTEQARSINKAHDTVKALRDMAKV
ncbi:ferritin-like domain-containing protein [Pedobacter chitinilyticus]|uniref:PA2169 family four-helix-bundle protein n=1 Tax=Pedobacter chitinilyticus TaxID=2233776 RepID=A0A3S3PSQ3_9SPHI|nr:PA2169 family four-helix-bundle protein [Pedobacter chitinilyticus]RWU05039.1 PA2169 family four-helix-bundle protein [Pedobacter chitinilyticus]